MGTNTTANGGVVIVTWRHMTWRARVRDASCQYAGTPSCGDALGLVSFVVYEFVSDELQQVLQNNML